MWSKISRSVIHFTDQLPDQPGTNRRTGEPCRCSKSVPFCAQAKMVSGYVFNESAASLRATGPIGGVDAAGQEFVVNSAILFPTAEDGIRGEICITRHPFEDVARGSVDEQLVDGSFPAAEMSNAKLLDSLLARLQRHDAGACESLLSARHSLAIRMDDRDGTPRIHTGETGATAARILGDLFSGRDVAMVSRLVSAWYVFAEYTVALGDGGLRHVALVQSVEGQRLTSSFGYGWEGA